MPPCFKEASSTRPIAGATVLAEGEAAQSLRLASASLQGSSSRDRRPGPADPADSMWFCAAWRAWASAAAPFEPIRLAPAASSQHLLRLTLLSVPLKCTGRSFAQADADPTSVFALRPGILQDLPVQPFDATLTIGDQAHPHRAGAAHDSPPSISCGGAAQVVERRAG